MQEQEIFLDKNELIQLNDLKNEYEYVVNTLGKLDVEMFMFQNKLKEISSDKEKFYNTLMILQQKEDELGKTLTEKYGNGSIDIITGKFTKS